MSTYIDQWGYLTSRGNTLGIGNTNLPFFAQPARVMKVVFYVTEARARVDSFEQRLAEFTEALKTSSGYRTFPEHELSSVCAAPAPVTVRVELRTMPRPWPQTIRAFRGPTRRMRKTCTSRR